MSSGYMLHTQCFPDASLDAADTLGYRPPNDDDVAVSKYRVLP